MTPGEPLPPESVPRTPSSGGLPLAETQQTETKRHRLRLIQIILIVGLIALAAYGIQQRRAAFKELEQIALAADKDVVAVTLPQKTPVTVTIDLPGETQAFIQAPIYAQANGYLKKWYFDIGAHVRKGDILAEIDTPALDQQLAQAQANLKQAQAALWLSQSTYDRYAGLLKNKVISAQDFDNQTGDYKEKQAAVATDEANLGQIQALMTFKKVVAPFDGIVSARNTDIGALINPTSGTPLFTVAQINPLRVYVNIPQTMAASVQPGAKAEVTFDTFPGKKFPAEVVATAGAINPSTRTLLTQLILHNTQGELLPGAYATVHLKIETDSSSLLLPANVLLFRSEGASVGVVGPGNKVEIRRIRIRRDLGDKLEVAEGLTPTDRVILNPPDSLTAGTVVEIAGNEGRGNR